MDRIRRQASVSGVRGREDGPLHARCEVLATRRVGSYWSVTFVAPELASRSQPGQFVSLGVDLDGAVLRRAFSIAGITQRGPWSGTVEVVFDVVGRGTDWLARRTKHDVVDVVGPLGRPFPLPAQPVSCLLVGGGYGGAPLLFLAERLQAEGLRVDMVLGAATAQRVYNPIEVKRLSTNASFTTEDGSLGVTGRVTDVLDHAADRAGSGVVYGCGPMPMLAAVANWARDRGLPSQMAVEEDMACGTGVCWTCVVPVQRKHGVRNERACAEGPVFNGARVQWDAIRTPAMADPSPNAEPDS